MWSVAQRTQPWPCPRARVRQPAARSVLGAGAGRRIVRPPAVHIGAEGHVPLLPQVATAGGTHLKVAGMVHAFDPVHTAQQLRKDHLQGGGWVGLGGLHASRGLDSRHPDIQALTAPVPCRRMRWRWVLQPIPSCQRCRASPALRRPPWQSCTVEANI